MKKIKKNYKKLLVINTKDYLKKKKKLKREHAKTRYQNISEEQQEKITDEIYLKKTNKK